MARGDGYEVTRVVDEAGQVIKAGRLADRIELAVDAVSAVVEPPGRPQQYRGVVAGERSELAQPHPIGKPRSCPLRHLKGEDMITHLGLEYYD